MITSLQKTRKKMIPIFQKSGVTKAAIFGSFSRGEAKKDSDIDILVKLSASKTLLDFVGLKLDLEKKLGKKVDLVTYNALHPLLKEKILNEQVLIYEKK